MEITQVGIKTKNAVIILALVIGALAFRRSDIFLNPQLWAEDGIVFLQQYYDLGIKSLIQPYAGYQHLAIRLIVFFFGTIDFNLLYIPTLYCIAIILILFLIAWRLWLSAASLGIPYRIAYAVMFLFVPITSDVFMNITNLNGILSLYLINRLFITHHGIATRAGTALDLILVFIISLSGPASILLCPVIALMLWVERRELTASRIAPMVIILLCGIIQLIYVKFIDANFYRGTEGAPERYHLIKFFVKNMADILYMQDPPMSAMRHQTQLWISLPLLLLLAGAFVRCYLKLPFRNKYIIPLAAALYVASVIVAYWPNESYLYAMRNASRYFLVPYTCIGWIFVLSLHKRSGLIAIALYLLFFVFHRPHIQFALQDMQWKNQIMEYRDGKREMIDINPPGWKFRLPPYKQK